MSTKKHPQTGVGSVAEGLSQLFPNYLWQITAYCFHFPKPGTNVFVRLYHTLPAKRNGKTKVAMSIGHALGCCNRAVLSQMLRALLSVSVITLARSDEKVCK